jgi:5-methylcytosine-specific restriction endonuclease McrA
MTEYPDNWNRRRRLVYERDGYTCRNCGRSGGPVGDVEFHAHHVVP